MEKVDYVELKHFSNEYLDVLNSFELPEEQVQFTALPNKILEATEGQHRIVILSENEPVGFFLLHSAERVKEYSDNPKAMLLTALSVNHAKQGKGYAKQGMLLLSDFVKSEFPNCDEIVLVVNHKNLPAQQLYLKVGFQDTGKRKIGPIGEQFIMNLSV
ncbi:MULTISPECIES: GNAT family N-acetyltransferase [unclassified Peribacillus]|uniref:GNAT family N-acetyltransferase n=1 Tax=unclassified Peribacillus TaxID=2675266 RepID=UPI001F4D6494|nr:MULTISPECIES: GNAT family N-acetyltransferase [unclassified Peribacillus]MCK1986091.1 GNAT family N-acetyltransferase [Peribacillus sp. Aquil_B1]MCK2011263.1 GNAT family N-acetyltransferase [Peribacillus sp. Aquil_B8]